MDNFKIALIFAIVALVFATGFNMDYQDEKAEAENYCDMVRLNYWPDYEGTYSTQCPQPNDGLHLNLRSSHRLSQ